MEKKGAAPRETTLKRKGKTFFRESTLLVSEKGGKNARFRNPGNKQPCARKRGSLSPGGKKEEKRSLSGGFQKRERKIFHRRGKGGSSFPPEEKGGKKESPPSSRKRRSGFFSTGIFVPLCEKERGSITFTTPWKEYTSFEKDSHFGREGVSSNCRAFLGGCSFLVQEEGTIKRNLQGEKEKNRYRKKIQKEGSPSIGLHTSPKRILKKAPDPRNGKRKRGGGRLLQGTGDRAKDHVLRCVLREQGEVRPWVGEVKRGHGDPQKGGDLAGMARAKKGGGAAAWKRWVRGAARFNQKKRGLAPKGKKKKKAKMARAKNRGGGRGRKSMSYSRREVSWEAPRKKIAAWSLGGEKKGGEARLSRKESASRSTRERSHDPRPGQVQKRGEGGQPDQLRSFRGERTGAGGEEGGKGRICSAILGKRKVFNIG